MPKVRNVNSEKVVGLQKIVVGLTGGMGAGKSTVSAYLRSRGVPVVDADHIVHRALAKGGAAYRPVVRLFGQSCVGPSGELDRAVLAQAVFSNGRLRKHLESILHPLVFKEIKRRMGAHRRGLLVLDVPLLFETGLDRWVDHTVTVWAPRSVCLARMTASKRWTRPDAVRRLKAQMSPREKRRRSNVLLNNSGSRRDLYRQIDQWLAGLFGGGGV